MSDNNDPFINPNFPRFLSVDDPTARGVDFPALNSGQYFVPPLVDGYGVQWSRLFGGTAPIVGKSPTDDAIAPADIYGLWTINVPYLYDPADDSFSRQRFYLPENDDVASGDYQGAFVINAPVLYQESGLAYQRQRTNDYRTLLADNTYSTEQTVLTDNNYNWRGLHLVVIVTDYTAGTITPYIQGYEPISGEVYDILVGNPIGAVGTYIFKVYPGLPATPNAIANDILPGQWQFKMAVSSANNFDYSVSALYVL